MSKVLPLIVVAIVLMGSVASGQQSVLLTDNGLTNEKAADYAKLPHFNTGGAYLPSPVLAGGDVGQTKVGFAEGALTDGNVTYNSVKPAPYAYWQGARSGELLFDLGRMCQIDRVRVNLLNSGPHGTSQVQVFVKGDPLEFPDNLKVGVIENAMNGWNELPVGKRADGLRLVFAAQEGKSYITASEVEIWGQVVGEATTAQAMGAASPKRVSDGFTWWAFDFGPKDSPSFGEFYVSSMTDVYDKQRGFGWQPYKDGQPLVESNFGPSSAAVPGLGERDRGAKKKSVSCDRLYRDFVSSCEYYHSQVRQTLAVDVPNGTYRCLSMHGDIEYGRQGKQNFWIEAEGKPVVKEITLPPTLVTDVVYDVTVTDGQLDLTFDAQADDPAQKGFGICGLVIVPAGTAAEKAFADKRIALVRAAIQRERDDYFARTFKLTPYVETATMVEPTAADRKRGFIAWTPSWMTLLYPNSVPTAEVVGRPLTAFAAPGEYEPVVVAVRALEPLKGLKLQIGDLKGAAGVIPASAVELRTVKCWPQRAGSSWSTEYQVMPELLETGQTLNLEKDTTGEYWLTILVPAKAKPGQYAAPVRVSSGGREWQTTLRLQVLPFKLAEPERVVGMYWYDNKVSGEALDKQVRDMVAHGMRAVTVNCPPKLSNVDGKLVVDTTDLRALLKRLRQLGITGPVPHNANHESAIKRLFPQGDQDALYVQVTAELEKVSNDPECLKLLHYPVDEIGNDDARGEKAHHLCELVAKVPGATSYITVNNYKSGEKWGSTFDIWCGNVDYQTDQEQTLLASGKRYMRYGSSYVNDCRRARNNCGLGFYKRPAEAMYFWHYQCYNADPFNDLDGDARDWCAAYPGPDGTPIPTMDWESHREGIDDMRYVATLKQAIAKAEKGTAAQKQAAAKARAELEAVLAVDDSITQTRWAEKLSHDEYNNLRWRLAQAIMALQ
ncbi:MAG: DUF4091 domain-containing protein [Armatimonadia bacterium]